MTQSFMSILIYKVAIERRSRTICLHKIQS
ncbi:hypothetical protein ACJIZ3_014315 [Penstemon smallii]|uniref:Uncharacterized protein n=1 Tax=Penstemon smallii TaxID=265156 RepID=A0ABD3RJ75_9LAMI